MQQRVVPNIPSLISSHILPLVGPGVGFRQCKKPKKSNPRAQNGLAVVVVIIMIIMIIVVVVVVLLKE